MELIIPHIARLLVGPRFRSLPPTEMIIGACYPRIIDMLARSVALVEIPLGILTVAVGAPFFLRLLACGRRGWE